MFAASVQEITNRTFVGVKDNDGAVKTGGKVHLPSPDGP